MRSNGALSRSLELGIEGEVCLIHGDQKQSVRLGGLFAPCIAMQASASQGEHFFSFVVLVHSTHGEFNPASTRPIIET